MSVTSNPPVTNYQHNWMLFDMTPNFNILIYTPETGLEYELNDIGDIWRFYIDGPVTGGEPAAEPLPLKLWLVRFTLSKLKGEIGRSAWLAGTFKLTHVPRFYEPVIK